MNSNLESRASGAARSLPHDRIGSPAWRRPPLGAFPAHITLALCSKDHVCNNQQKVSNGSQDVTYSSVVLVHRPRRRTFEYEDEDRFAEDEDEDVTS